MRLPHPLLILLTAVLGWIGASAWAAATYCPQASSAGNPLAILRSGYGSTIARLVKDSLHTYWHGGKQEKAGEHDHHDDEHDKPAPGSLKLLRSKPVHAAEEHDHGEESWLAHLTEKIAALEDHRTERNSPFATSAAHQRFLTASANWRLYQAYKLDPSDQALYEIAHFTMLSRKTSVEQKRRDTEQLAQQTLDLALSPQSGPAAALTGAGAIINLLNEQLTPHRNPPPEPERLKQEWQLLNRCFERYHTLRNQAIEDGWWTGIPEIRRQEIEAYGKEMERLSKLIQGELTNKSVIR